MGAAPPIIVFIGSNSFFVNSGEDAIKLISGGTRWTQVGCNEIEDAINSLLNISSLLNPTPKGPNLCSFDEINMPIISQTASKFA